MHDPDTRSARSYLPLRLSLDGVYATLYREQFSSGLVEARCQDGVVLAGGEVVSVRAPGDGAAREPAPA
jgi:hypothetical protein